MENATRAPEADSFAERLAAATPTPGGGAAAARVGLYACSLLRMVTGITLAKLSQNQSGAPGAPGAPRAPGSPSDTAAVSPGIAAGEIQAALDASVALGKRFHALEKEDMAAFQSYLDALRLPRGTPEEKEERRRARAAAAGSATDAPLSTIRAARDALLLSSRLQELSRSTPLKAESDLGAAVELAMAACRVAELNVRVNLPELTPEKREEVLKEWRSLSEQTGRLYGELHSAFAGSPP